MRESRALDVETPTIAIDYAALRAPFAPSETEFRIQSTYDKGGVTQAIVVAYIDARAVMDRLDEVVGAENWSFDYDPLLIEKGELRISKGRLTIYGATKCDVGDAAPTEPTKSCVSDSLKRAAVLWGIGRYLYDLPVFFATPTKRGQSWVLDDKEMGNLRNQLRAKLGHQPQPPRASAPTQSAQTQRVEEQPQTAQQPTQSAQPVRAAVHADALRRANQQEQADLYATLKEYFSGKPTVENFLEGALAPRSRHIDASLLPTGKTDLSVGEIAAILKLLDNYPKLEKAGQSAQEVTA